MNGIENSYIIVAAVVFCILILILYVVHLVRRDVKSHRIKKTPFLEVTDTKVNKPAYSSNAGYLSFRVINTFGGTAIIDNMKLVLEQSGQSHKSRELQPGKRDDRHDFIVMLRSDKNNFSLDNNPEFYKKSKTSRGEGLNCRIKLQSDEHNWYRFVIEINWHDQNNKKYHKTTRSKFQYIEFATV